MEDEDDQKRANEIRLLIEECQIDDRCLKCKEYVDLKSSVE